MKKLIVGNWKMNGSVQMAKTLTRDLINGISLAPELLGRAEFVICPSNLHMYIVRHAITTIDYINLGAQDCAPEEDSPHTGDSSAAMLKDSACRYVIVGHSERRIGRGETDDVVAAKIRSAHHSGLKVILCVGETLSERKAGQAQARVLEQLAVAFQEGASARNVIIAYEPVWAIGTGDVASASDIADMHGVIRQALLDKKWENDHIRVIYGGSIKADNAGQILNQAGVNGALVGGASLDAQVFISIAASIDKI
jgi:triosephosphate isomerase